MRSNTQGGTANYTGGVLEAFVKARLSERKYSQVPGRRFEAAKGLGQAIYATQFVLCTGIYGTPIRCDFLLFRPNKECPSLAIETKWQQTSGTADEKYPYLVANIKDCYPCPAIVLLDGEGYRQGAARWIKAQCDSKLLHVFTMGEFTKWANRGGL